MPVVYDSQFVRETLERRAVAGAAQAPQPAAVAQLREVLDSQDAAIQARHFTGFFALDEAMHRALMGMAGRPFVWQVISGAQGAARPRALPVAVRGRVARHDHGPAPRHCGACRGA
jgi:DNA-binding GntR family transcriptional regulator